VPGAQPPAAVFVGKGLRQRCRRMAGLLQKSPAATATRHEDR